MIQNLEPLPIITSIQSMQSNSLPCSPNSSKINSALPHQNNPTSNNNNNIFQKPQPIGIYNFSSNKSYISSFEQNVDEAVFAFIEQNRDNIIKYVAQEVQKKLEEKINPMNEEITRLKKEFNSLYEEEWNDFKESNILNDCHNNIMELNNKMNIMNENINAYNDNIKGFNIADNRLQFLNKLNKDLDEFISGIGSNLCSNEKTNENFGLNLENMDQNYQKIEKEMNKQDNLNNELNNVFYETMEMLNDITKDDNLEENKDISTVNNNIISCTNILNNFKNTINTFDTKFSYEKPINNSPNTNVNINTNNRNNGKENIFDGLPNFFD